MKLEIKNNGRIIVDSVEPSSLSEFQKEMNYLLEDLRQGDHRVRDRRIDNYMTKPANKPNKLG